MNMFKKDLIILIDNVDLKSIDSRLLEECDRVAMAPSAMLAFEQNGLSYLTFDDFYDYRQFRIDNTKLIKATENLFSVLDKKYEPFLNFPRAFTGNIYWFLIFFVDVYYTCRICEKINKTYDKVYFVGDSARESLFKVGLEFSAKGFTFNSNNIDIRLNNKVKMLRAGLSSKCTWLNSFYSQPIAININKEQLIYLRRRVPEKLLLKAKSFFSKSNYKNKRVIFVFQDGYEVALLKKYMPEFIFINPVSKLLQKAKNANMNKSAIKTLFTEELEKFIDEWFPVFRTYIFGLFNFYHSKIICNLKAFSADLSKAFDYYKPVVLFYSVGSSEVYGDLGACFANQRNIPIFYFQHGGATVFFKRSYLKFVEQNKNIRKINILQSSIEKQLVSSDIVGGSSALGSIKLYSLCHNHQVRNISGGKFKRKVLYCAVALNKYSYKSLEFNKYKELFEVNKDIINTTDKFQLKMDIKIHPLSEECDYSYFRELLRSRQSKNIRVLKSFPVERIIKNYGLLILDCISSAMIPASMVLDIPIIMYLEDIACLREETMPDIKERFYLVRNKSDLEKYINLYNSGKLESKFSLDIVDKYAFPVNAGDPGVNISDYIQREISG